VLVADTTAIAVTGLTAAATSARVNDLLDEFTYANGSDRPVTADRAATLMSDDGASRVVDITEVNDAPGRPGWRATPRGSPNVTRSCAST